MFPDKEVIFISYNLLYTSSLIANDIEKRGLLKEFMKYSNEEQDYSVLNVVSLVQ